MIMKSILLRSLKESNKNPLTVQGSSFFSFDQKFPKLGFLLVHNLSDDLGNNFPIEQFSIYAAIFSDSQHSDSGMVE